MTREELKSADTRSLISALQYCGRDSYYATYYDEVVDEITKRLDKIAELEKENAELKGLKDVATLIRANNDTVVTLMQLNNMLVSKSQQLTKAKEIIRDLLNLPFANNEEVFADVVSHLDEAEQFLKEQE